MTVDQFNQIFYKSAVLETPALLAKVSVLTLEEGLYETTEIKDEARIVSKILPELNLTAKSILEAKLQFWRYQSTSHSSKS